MNHKGVGDGVGALGKGVGDTASGATSGISDTTKVMFTKPMKLGKMI